MYSLITECTNGSLAWNSNTVTSIDMMNSTESIVEQKPFMTAQHKPSPASPATGPPPLSQSSQSVSGFTTPLGTSISQVLQQSLGIDPKHFQHVESLHKPASSLVLPPISTSQKVLQKEARGRLEMKNQLLSSAAELHFPLSQPAQHASAPLISVATSISGEPSSENHPRSGSASPKSDRTSPPCMLPAKHNLLQRYHADVQKESEQAKGNRSMKARSSTSSERSSPEITNPIKREATYDTEPRKRACHEFDTSYVYSAFPGNGIQSMSGRNTPESLADSDAEQSFLPGFVMHPSGNYYIPIPISQETVTAALNTGGDKFAVTYPISINVKIGMPAPRTNGFTNPVHNVGGNTEQVRSRQVSFADRTTKLA